MPLLRGWPALVAPSLLGEGASSIPSDFMPLTEVVVFCLWLCSSCGSCMRWQVPLGVCTCGDEPLVCMLTCILFACPAVHWRTGQPLQCCVYEPFGPTVMFLGAGCIITTICRAAVFHPELSVAAELGNNGSVCVMMTGACRACSKQHGVAAAGLEVPSSLHGDHTPFLKPVLS